MKLGISLDFAPCQAGNLFRKQKWWRQYEERVKLTEQRLLNKLAAKLNCQVVPKINDLAAVPG